MSETEKTQVTKQNGLNMNRSWHWLMYLDILLPLILFLLAWMPLDGMRQLFAKLFHGYQLYVMNPIPDIAHLIGIVGLVYHLTLLSIAALKKRWLDLFISLMICAFAIVWFATGTAWSVLQVLSFS